MPTGKVRIQTEQSPFDAKRIDQALRDVWGIRDITLRKETNEVTFTFDEKASSYGDFKQALENIGYEVTDLELPVGTEGQRL